MNKKEVKQKQTKIPVNLEYERNHQKLEILITKEQTLSSRAGRRVWPTGRNPPGILNGKLRIPNRKKTDTDTEDDDGDDEDEEMPETTGMQTYDTSKRDGKYIPIHTNLQDDAIQIHTDGETFGENLEPIIRQSKRIVNKPNRYGSVPYTKNFWNKVIRKKFIVLSAIGTMWNGHKDTPQPETIQKQTSFQMIRR